MVTAKGGTTEVKGIDEGAESLTAKGGLTPSALVPSVWMERVTTHLVKTGWSGLYAELPKADSVATLHIKAKLPKADGLRVANTRCFAKFLRE